MEKLKINRTEQEPLTFDDNDLSLIEMNNTAQQVNSNYIPSNVTDNLFSEELSEIEYNFCQRFIFSKDIVDAMSHSGINITDKKNWQLLKEGRKIMLKPHVQVYLKELQLELRKKADIQKEDMVNWLLDLKLRAQQSEQLATELKAIDTIGKALGLMAPKQIDYSNKIEISFGDFNPDDYIPCNTNDQDYEELK